MITGPGAVWGIPTQQQKEKETRAVNELPSAAPGRDGDGHRWKETSVMGDGAHGMLCSFTTGVSSVPSSMRKCPQTN